MTAERTVQQGDFTQLAKQYRHRVGYSLPLLDGLIRMVGHSRDALRVADVGAGTGKLTENLCHFGLRVDAVEPNDAMREEGQKQTKQLSVQWHNGSGEATGLQASTYDWVAMGSSFHWVNLEQGLKEFHRILKPGGYFTAIWNPRDIERSTLQKRVDNLIHTMVPGLKRVSSGAKSNAQDWLTLLGSTPHFTDVVFTEARFEVEMSQERYLGLWNSVNDVRAQAGEAKWAEIMTQIKQLIQSERTLSFPYLARAWTARRVD